MNRFGGVTLRTDLPVADNQTVQAKQKQRDTVAADVEKYLAKGGEIKPCPSCQYTPWDYNKQNFANSLGPLSHDEKKPGNRGATEPG